MKKEKLIKISVTGVFCALAFVMTLILRFKVLHLTFDLKDTIIGIISLMYGPIYGVVSAGIVSVLELSISETELYGLIMNFLSSATFTMILGSIYKYKRTLKGAIIGVSMSVIGVCVVMCIANIFITPLYIKDVDSNAVIAMIPTLLLPFNFCKALINAAATIAIYKPVRGVLKKAGITQTVRKNATSKQYISFVLFIISAIIICLTILLLINVMNAEINFL